MLAVNVQDFLEVLHTNNHLYGLNFIEESDIIAIDVPSEPQNIEDSDGTDEQSVREACDELKDYFNHRLVESLLKATRHSLDTMRRRFFSRLP